MWRFPEAFDTRCAPASDEARFSCDGPPTTVHPLGQQTIGYEPFPLRQSTTGDEPFPLGQHTTGYEPFDLSSIQLRRSTRTFEGQSVLRCGAKKPVLVATVHPHH